MSDKFAQYRVVLIDMLNIVRYFGALSVGAFVADDCC